MTTTNKTVAVTPAALVPALSTFRIPKALGWGPLKFRFVDDSGNLRLDLNKQDQTGWILARGLDLGISTIEHTFLTQPPVDGAVLASSYRPVTTMQVPLLLGRQASFSAMKSLMDALAVELDRPMNRIEYLPQGSSYSYFITTYRASIPSLVKGDFTPSAFLLMQTTTILMLQIMREPVLTGAGSYI